MGMSDPGDLLTGNRFQNNREATNRRVSRDECEIRTSS